MAPRSPLASRTIASSSVSLDGSVTPADTTRRRKHHTRSLLHTRIPPHRTRSPPCSRSPRSTRIALRIRTLHSRTIHRPTPCPRTRGSQVPRPVPPLPVSFSTFPFVSSNEARCFIGLGTSSRARDRNSSLHDPIGWNWIEDPAELGGGRGSETCLPRRSLELSRVREPSVMTLSIRRRRVLSMCALFHPRASAM